ncbi:cation transporter [Bacillus atrophaeus]|uniref:cation transporter n=1 Tax=Bacillus atrophaeus TaxID=1452 RepID=UPI001EFA63D9|nr:cation transporter [Bacillus atrophaeus]
MAHHHNQEHSHEPANYGVVFTFGIGIILLSYGIVGDSLALVTDAGHNLSDVFGLVVSWVAVWLGKKAPTNKRTYGFKRSSILSVLCNAVFLLVALGAIAWEAAGSRPNRHGSRHYRDHHKCNNGVSFYVWKKT